MSPTYWVPKIRHPSSVGQQPLHNAVEAFVDLAIPTHVGDVLNILRRGIPARRTRTLQHQLPTSSLGRSRFVAPFVVAATPLRPEERIAVSGALSTSFKPVDVLPQMPVVIDAWTVWTKAIVLLTAASVGVGVNSMRAFTRPGRGSSDHRMVPFAICRAPRLLIP